MKVKFGQEASTIATSGVQGTSSFNIATTAHMFHILSSGLYSDKVGAVIRELSCNAMDAHIMSNQPERPFEVKLPTLLDPTFYIKDFGPGLNHAEVTELYTTYGMSTKQDDERATGAFGLGSKSPFAYTDMFSIVAVKDGVKRIYTAHKENNAPVISLQAQEPADADWPSGVMVTMPVNPADVAEFTSKATLTLRWFTVRPVVLGLPENALEAALPQYQMKGERYALGPSGMEVTKPLVIMGNVAYPLDASRLGSVPMALKSLMTSNVHLQLEVGAVIPTPSRESLQYDKEGIATILAALDAAARDVAANILERVRAERTHKWAFHQAIRAYAMSLPSGVRYSLRDVLALVMEDDAEIKAICSIVDDSAFTLPRWVGRWNESSDQQSVRDYARTVFEREKLADYPQYSSLSLLLADKPELEAELEAAEALELDNMAGSKELTVLWMRADPSRDSRSGGRGAVASKVVTFGSYAAGPDSKPVTLSYTEPLTVYYADSPYARERVRQALLTQALSHGGEVAALVVLCKTKAGRELAKRYAQAIVSERGCGLPTTPVATSSVTFTPVARSKSSPDRAREALDLRQRLARAEFNYMDFRPSGVSVRLSDKALGDMPSEDVYYVFENGRARRSWSRVVEFQAGERRVELRLNQLEMLGHAIRGLITELGDAYTGPKAVILVSRAQARKYQFDELGFKSLGDGLIEALSCDELLEALQEKVDTFPVVRSLESSSGPDCGFTGVLAQLLYNKVELGEEIVEVLGDDDPLVCDARRLVKAFKAGKAQSSAHYSSRSESLRDAVELFMAYLPATRGKLQEVLTLLSVQDVAQRARQAYPLLDLIAPTKVLSAPTDAAPAGLTLALVKAAVQASRQLPQADLEEAVNALALAA